MKRSTSPKPNTDQAKGPMIPGSPLYHLLDRVARAVAKRLLAQSESSDGSPPKPRVTDLSSATDTDPLLPK